MADPADDIAAAAAQPKKAEIAGRSAEAHPLPDRIEAAKFAAANQPRPTGRRRPRGIGLVRLVPPGAV